VFHRLDQLAHFINAATECQTASTPQMAEKVIKVNRCVNKSSNLMNKYRLLVVPTYQYSTSTPASLTNAN